MGFCFGVRARGWLWMVREFGLRRTPAYGRARRAGVTIDYSRILTPDERALLSEHFTMPWERPSSKPNPSRGSTERKKG